MSVTYNALWSEDTNPWQLDLPWQFINYYAYLAEMSLATFLITGINVNLSRIYEFIADVGSYLITGVNTSFVKALNLVLSVANYTITGININLGRFYNMAVAKAEYLITGINTSFQRAWNMVLDKDSVFPHRGHLVVL